MDGLVRQGPFQGVLTMIGLIMPLVAMYGVIFRSGSSDSKFRFLRRKSDAHTDAHTVVCVHWRSVGFWYIFEG